MAENPKNNRLKKIEQDNPGFFSGISRTLMLVLRLLGDKRVSLLLKLLPLSTLVYLVSPLDAAIPAIDDAVVIGIGTYLFVELCPPDVVEEHRARLAGLAPRGAADAGQSVAEEDEVLEAEFSESAASSQERKE